MTGLLLKEFDRWPVYLQRQFINTLVSLKNYFETFTFFLLMAPDYMFKTFTRNRRNIRCELSGGRNFATVSLKYFSPNQVRYMAKRTWSRNEFLHLFTIDNGAIVAFVELRIRGTRRIRGQAYPVRSRLDTYPNDRRTADGRRRSPRSFPRFPKRRRHTTLRTSGSAAFS